MLWCLLALQDPAGTKLVEDAWSQVSSAKSITVTVLRTSAEFGGESRVRYAYRSGGYFRADDGVVIDIGTPNGGWTYSPAAKKYQIRPALPKDYEFAQNNALGAFQGTCPAKSAPVAVTWRGRNVLKVEVDGTKLTKDTKMFLFVDSKSHYPVGVSANLGSLTQITVFEDLKLDPKIADSVFTFTPPKGWRKVTAASGGWN
jgi:hypothetical protein